MLKNKGKIVIYPVSSNGEETYSDGQMHRIENALSARRIGFNEINQWSDNLAIMTSMSGTHKACESGFQRGGCDGVGFFVVWTNISSSFQLKAVEFHCHCNSLQSLEHFPLIVFVLVYSIRMIQISEITCQDAVAQMLNIRFCLSCLIKNWKKKTYLLFYKCRILPAHLK